MSKKGAIGGHGYRSAFLRAAHALIGRPKHEPTSAELKLARHMAQNDATWEEIRAALGWDCTLATTKTRLQKKNIFVRGGCNAKCGRKSKYGGLTSLNKNRQINQTSYRPKTMAP